MYPNSLGSKNHILEKNNPASMYNIIYPLFFYQCYKVLPLLSDYYNSLGIPVLKFYLGKNNEALISPISVK